jgi:cation transport ATPase
MQLYVGLPYFASAYKVLAAAKPTANMDCLVMLSTTVGACARCALGGAGAEPARRSLCVLDRRHLPGPRSGCGARMLTPQRAVEDDVVADCWHAEGAFFETSTILLALVFSGRALEARTKTARAAPDGTNGALSPQVYARRQATSALSSFERLQALARVSLSLSPALTSRHAAPPTQSPSAELVAPAADRAWAQSTPVSLPSQLLERGDVVRVSRAAAQCRRLCRSQVPPGCRAPADGEVVSGSGDFDEAMLTGEVSAVL